MKNRTFILLIVIIVCSLLGWFFYVSSQAKEARSVEEISMDWWGSAHADASAEAFIHWNEDDPAEIPVYCAKCHSGTAFLDFLGQDGSTAMVVDAPGEINSVITCIVCHNESADALTGATFPSGVEISLGASDALCASCHSGMSAGTAVAEATVDYADDEVIADASFINPHYAFAASTWLGSEAAGGYQYADNSYVTRYLHAEGVQSCTQCHDPHSLHTRKDYGSDDNLCAACHSNVTGYTDYRDVFVDGIDYDGDDIVEGLYHEIEGVTELLYASLQSYAMETLEEPIIWANSYPYFFNDLNGDGIADEDEANFGNSYKSFTPRLMRATFNYQFSRKDPAAYIHNGKYMLQLLYDTIEDLSEVVEVDMSGLVRPETD